MAAARHRKRDRAAHSGRVAMDVEIGGACPPHHAQRRVVEYEVGPPHLQFAQQSQRHARIGRSGEIAQHLAQPCLGGGSIPCADAKVKVAVLVAREAQHRSVEHNARRRDDTAQRRTEAEIDGELAQRQLRATCAHAQIDPARDQLDPQTGTERDLHMRDVDAHAARGVGERRGKIGRQRVERNRPGRQPPRRHGKRDGRRGEQAADQLDS